MWPILGILEILFFAAFFVLLVIGTAFDRRGTESMKWYVFFGGLVLLAGYFWSDWSFSAALAAATSSAFWLPVAYYLAGGLAYSVIEFVLGVRRAAQKYGERWSDLVQRRLEIKQVDEEGKEIGTKHMTLREAMLDRTPSNMAAVKDSVQRFVSKNQSYDYVILDVNEAGTAPEPKINKIRLAECVGAWTLLWPAYAVSLVIGDLLTEVFNWVADIMVNLSGRFVRRVFSKTFTL